MLLIHCATCLSLNFLLVTRPRTFSDSFDLSGLRPQGLGIPQFNRQCFHSSIMSSVLFILPRIDINIIPILISTSNDLQLFASYPTTQDMVFRTATQALPGRLLGMQNFRPTPSHWIRIPNFIKCQTLYMTNINISIKPFFFLFFFVSSQYILSWGLWCTS